MVAKLVFTKCISKESEDHSQQIVYDYEFIEDYTESLETEVDDNGVHLQDITSVGGSSDQLLLPTTSDRRAEIMEDCKKPLLKSTDYSPLNHPLTLMVRL